MPELQIDCSDIETCEMGAKLLSLLAYPDLGDDVQRQRLERSLCVLALKSRAESDPSWATTPQRIKPIYICCDPRDIKRDTRTLERRLRDRMIAARMAIALLKKALTGEIPKLPTGVERLSLNELAKMVQEQAQQSEPENVETRIWRPSLPVIHIAAALQVNMRLAERAGLGETSWGDLLRNQGTLNWVFSEAQAYETLIDQNASWIPINPEVLIRVRLINSAAPEGG